MDMRIRTNSAPILPSAGPAREAVHRTPPRDYSSGVPLTPPTSLPFVVRASPIQGQGAFATRDIPAGTRIIEYAGERLTPAEADARYPDVPGERYHTFLFAIDDDVVVDASVNGNEARFLNHSCAPNCDVVIDQKRLWIEAIQDIEVGEELVYDYAFILPERHTPAAKKRYPCHCGAITCRGTMLAKKR